MTRADGFRDGRPHQPIPAGMCQCGCGQATATATCDHRPTGRKKGVPLRYIHGHNRRRNYGWVEEDRGYVTPCWIWQGGIEASGYGYTCRDGRKCVVHRQAWVDANGPIPAGLLVCHHCDVPACMNPAHLFLGTQQDNIDDMMAKGRGVIGERTWIAKLSEANVRDIRAAHRAGQSLASLAREFGVHKTTVREVVTRETWKHVEDVAA